MMVIFEREKKGALRKTYLDPVIYLASAVLEPKIAAERKVSHMLICLLGYPLYSLFYISSVIPFVSLR